MTAPDLTPHHHRPAPHRAPQRTGRGLARMIIATSLWGTASAGLATVDTPGFAAAPVAAGAAATLLIFAVLRGHAPWAEFRHSPRLFATLGALEVLNLACYVAALKIGPLPVVVALHLTAPILLILTHLVRGRRPLTLTVGVELAAVAVALALIAGQPPATTSLGPALAGCVLAVASAACVAALITVVVREADGRSSESAAGLQLLAAAVLGAPLFVLAALNGSAPTIDQSLGLAAIGGLLLGPGFAFFWLAARDLTPTTTGVVGLNEALVATLAGALLIDAQTTATDLVASALVLAAAALELGRPNPQQLPDTDRPAPTAVLHRKPTP
ncbi:hypothetical protein ACFWPH_28210 [Nocardia sp. NPDC058499]|uniref:hypothetical protein n=1 Tax=Nocardia sp. NPDC058499 TaxID=3346530 RepID=UPI00364B8AD8